MANDQRSPNPLNFRKVILAESDAHDWRVGAIQALLIILWHWIVPPLTLSLVAWDWQINKPIGEFAYLNPDLTPSIFFRFFREALAAKGMVCFILAESAIGYMVYRFSTVKQKPPVGALLQCWWLTCLWGTIAIPVGAFILVDALTTQPAIALTHVFWFLIAVIVPTLVIKSDKRRGLYRNCADCGMQYDRSGSICCLRCNQELEIPRSRIIRWRPVCPDCGYSLRKLAGIRCPECGSEFPTNRKSFRRWAFHRLPWDRLDRGYFPTAYLKTVTAILLTPRRAARSLTIPDRWKRCRRWAFVHIAIAILIGVLVFNNQHYVRYVLFHHFNSFVYRLWPTRNWEPVGYMSNEVGSSQTLVWATQTLVAWTISLCTMVGVAAAVSYYAPGRHRAAKRAGVKWALYLSAMIAVIIATWSMLFAAISAYGLWAIYFPKFLLDYIPRIPVTLVLIFYGTWWAIGVSANPFNRRRGCAEAVRYGLAYFAVWIVISRLIVSVGPLSALL